MRSASASTNIVATTALSASKQRRDDSRNHSADVTSALTTPK